MWMTNIMKKSNNMMLNISKTSLETVISNKSKWLLALTLILALAMPIILYTSRIDDVGEFEYLIYYRLLFFNDYLNSLAMLAALLAAMLLRPLWPRVGQLAQWITLYPLRTCIIAFIVLSGVGRFVYQAFPLAMDEYVPLLQARIFAQGSLTTNYPLELLDRMVIPGFQGYFILVNHETGQAASAYWPGLALLMTPFALFEMEWLLNPLLAAIGLWLIGDLASQASGKTQARGWAILAALACPQYTINAMSYYAMTGLLTLNLLYLWLLLKCSWRGTLLAGLVGSFALIMHNPIPHILFAIPCIIWLLSNRSHYAQLAPLVLGYFPLVLLLGLGWLLLTHSLGLNYGYEPDKNIGFLEVWRQKIQEIFVWPDTRIIRIRIYSLCKTIIWATPGLLLVLFFSKPSSLIQRLLLSCLILSFAFYLFIPYDQGHGWGYRYIHSAWGLIAISAGIFAVSGHKSQRNFIIASLLAGSLATSVFAFQTGRTIAISNALQPTLPTVKNDNRILVFIASHPSLYTIDLIRNYPKDQGKIIRMVSYGTEEDAVLAKQLSAKAFQVSTSPMGSVWQLPLEQSHANTGTN